MRFALCALALVSMAVIGADPNAPINPDAYKEPVKVAFVGDSITAGYGTKNRGTDSFPSQLERMLDKKWVIKNFGVSGTTLLNHGDNPYQKQGAFKGALELNPDVVVIMLGTNDTKPQNWKFKEEFAADYKNLIAQFAALSSKPRIFICRPVPVPGKGNFGINEAGVLEQQPIIEALAKSENTGLIDMYGSLKDKDALLPDRVHPNNEGAALMAKCVFRALTGKEFVGEIPAAPAPPPAKPK